MKVKIIGTIEHKENVPETATLASINQYGNVQGFYKIENVRFSDGTTEDVLMYFSYLSNTWVRSCNEVRWMVFKQIG